MTARRIVLVAACSAVASAALAAGTPAAAPATPRPFQTPSGNIACLVADGASVRCEIRKRDWSPPPKPRTCLLDWGNGLVLGARNRAGYLCAGDTILPPPGRPYRVLAYGRSIRAGAITCASARTGVTCTNLKRHGFRLSRERVRLF